VGETGKKEAAALVVREFEHVISNAKTIGVGTGSTVSIIVDSLIDQGLLDDKIVVPSSIDTAMKLSLKGISPTEPLAVDTVDVYIDGADEVDQHGNMIKGRGAALLGEKMLAYKSKVNIFVVDESKIVDKLGSMKPVPIEVHRWMIRTVEKIVRNMGYNYSFRSGGKDGPVISDFCGVIIDLHTGPINDPYQLEDRLRSIPGLVETGLFLGYADYVVVGWDKGGGEVRKHTRSRGAGYDF
jgi:ribose 5-phosphate isomerase A